MSRVLVVEDEEHLALGLRFNLENQGYEVRAVRTGPEALEEATRGVYDLVLLDVMLPGPLDGFGVARAIRTGGNFVPILMLTARDTVEDRVRGIEAGADDYLVKPFDLDELVARVRGMLRRQAWTRRDHDREAESAEAAAQAHPAQPSAEGSAHPEGGEAGEPLRFGRCWIDFRSYRALTHAGEEVQLSPKEAEMMRLFAQHEGEVIARARFLEDVWREPATLETRTIDNFILRLRRYFEPDPRRPRHILSVRGIGYRFVR